MMNRINFADAAQVMPQKITNETKAMTINSLEVKVKFALDAANDGEGIVLTMRIEDRFGKFVLINYDPRKDRYHAPAKLYISKNIVDRAVSYCLDKLAARFPVCRQLTIDDMIEKEEDLHTSTERSHSNKTLDDLIEELVTQGYSYEDACDKAAAEFE